MSMSVIMMDVSFINLPSPGGSLDHTLYSPDMSNYPATSPQSVFMYEHDEGPDRGKSSQSVFEFPRPMEINDLGGELNTSFWSDCEGSLLETSFGDSGKASLWDFSGFDDISSPLQHPEDDLTCTPTLAELNNEDSQSFDAMLSSHNACIVPTAHKAKLRLHHNNNNVTLKTQCGMAGPASDVSSDSPRSQERVLVDQEPLIWPNSSPLSAKLGARSHKEKETKGIERLTLKTTHDSHRHHHPAKLVRKLFSRQGLDSALGMSDVTANEKGEHLEQAWQEVPSFVHDGGTDRQTNKACRTKSSPEGKRLTIKEELYTHRAFTTGAGDGYDSHDEGLGSEHEDQDEEDNENIKEEEEEEDGLSDVGEEYDACSDMSEDHGVATTSTATQDLFPQKVKSRRSEYDDLTPNPKRLLLIGNELHKLNKVISGMIPVSALPVSARNRSRKEKNKLASRACRLKKKAQHEANKLKLFGLEKEHDRLMQVITAIRRELLIYLEQPPKDPPCLSDKLNTLIQSILGQMVANHTQEFVSSVLEKTAQGSKLMGGLSFLTTHD